MRGVLAPDGWNLVVLAFVGAVLVVVSLQVPSPTVRYGTWLAVFTLWMLWFVLAAVRWLRTADV